MKFSALKPNTWKVLPLSIAILVSTPSAFAVPAAPGNHKLQQSNGDTIIARQWGDEWMHGWETNMGYSIVFDNVRNNWFYAKLDTSGQLAPSDVMVRPVDTSAAAIKGRTFTPVYQNGQEIPKHLRPTGNAKATAVQKAALAAGGALTLPEKAVPATGTGQLPVLMINFNDTASTYTTADFNTLLFATTGFSMKKYYEEVSYGNFTVSGSVLGWYAAANTHDYYGTNSGGSDAKPADLVEEAVIAADPTTNFATYDTDGDCFVDVVAIIHQGTGEEAGGAATDIWSHRWNLNSASFYGRGSSGIYTTNDTCASGGNVKVNDYIIQPEVLFGGQQTMGVFAHEYGHSFGLPDLYDTDGSSSGLGNWALMAGGSWNGVTRSGDRPSHMIAWSKYFLGWIAPTMVTTPLTGENVTAAADASDVYQIGTGTPASAAAEYYLVENRNKTKFDAGLPASGMAVWHIDEGKKTVNNSDNANECIPPADCSVNHYRIALVQADNNWDLENNNNRGDATDLYVSSATGFSGTTAPSSDWYNGSASDFSLTNISAAGATMTADFGVIGSSNGVLNFNAALFMVNENAGTVNVAVSRTGGSAGAISATCTTSDDTALAGSDYTTLSATLNWADGDATDKNCTINITDDALIEGNQGFNVSLSSPTGGSVLGAPSTTSVAIIDNETCSGTAVDLTGNTFETGADIDCLGTTSILGATGGTAVGSRVGFYAPSVTLNPSFSVSGVFSIGTNETFDGSNTAAISVGPIAAGPFSPYPSVINVSGMNGGVYRVTASLLGVDHTYPSDMQALLVSPQGDTVLLMNANGGGTDITGVNLTFDDAAASSIPNPMVSGTYKPTGAGTTDFTPPAPIAPYGATMASLKGGNPNGDWKLFMFDSAGGDGGTVSGGWSLHIEAR
jgi:M6 family metalloprotease-like protein